VEIILYALRAMHVVRPARRVGEWSMASKVFVVQGGGSDGVDVQVRRAAAFQIQINVFFFSNFKLSHVLLLDTEFANAARGATKKPLPWHSMRTPIPMNAAYSMF